MSRELSEPWLVSIWPGMGSVALTAGTFLIHRLRAQRLGTLAADGFFDLERIEIHDGVASVASSPSCEFFGWKAPAGGRDLVLFLGEAQPSHRGYEFCDHLLERAQAFGVSRVFTFAAMATQVHPGAAPRVFAAVNRRELLKELESHPVQVLKEGQISGLNGVMLASAAKRGLGAVCLLGEMPYFAVGVPNPKASLKVLEVFTRLAGLRLNLGDLAEQARQMEHELVKLMERMNLTIQGLAKSDDDEAGESKLTDLPDLTRLVDESGRLEDALDKATQGEGSEADATGIARAPDNLTAEDKRRIHELFRSAAKDRSRALALKLELDRLGVFAHYEDQFLDLFKRGG